ncbi:MAG: hypothetical protein QOE11_3169 [Solirubrobacteraceae bacterium]|nr:hypothetical protein [Solirubrobacteraceae bacterium]
MNDIPHQLRSLIEAAVADGVGMDDIEQELIEPMNLAAEDHDSVWLYALARSQHPHRRKITIIEG